MDDRIKILIIEDEMIIAAHLSLQLSGLGYDVTGIIPRAEEAILHLRQHQPDIVLLDINLKGDIDGIDMAHEMQKHHNIPIIYLTANSDDSHFERAKATKPFAFISKPFKKLELQRSIELAVSQIRRDQLPTQTAAVGEAPFVLSDSIFIRHHDKMVKIAINDILYIEADRNYCRVHCKDKEFLLVMTLKDFDEKLSHRHFLRIHRSFIVNMSHIDEIATSHVVIAKKAIPLSVEMKKQLLLHIQKV